MQLLIDMDEAEQVMALPEPEVREGLRRRASLTLVATGRILKVDPTTVYRWENDFVSPVGPALMIYGAFLNHLANERCEADVGLK